VNNDRLLGKFVNFVSVAFLRIKTELELFENIDDAKYLDTVIPNGERKTIVGDYRGLVYHKDNIKTVFSSNGSCILYKKIITEGPKQHIISKEVS